MTQNVEKAKKDLEKLEAEEAAAEANGTKTDIADDLKETSLEDKKE